MCFLVSIVRYLHVLYTIFVIVMFDFNIPRLILTCKWQIKKSTSINILLSCTSNALPCVYCQNKHKSTGITGWTVLCLKTQRKRVTKYDHICYTTGAETSHLVFAGQLLHMHELHQIKSNFIGCIHIFSRCYWGGKLNACVPSSCSSSNMN